MPSKQDQIKVLKRKFWEKMDGLIWEIPINEKKKIYKGTYLGM